MNEYLDSRYGTETPVIQQVSVEQAINAAKRDKTSTWRELIADE